MLGMLGVVTAAVVITLPAFTVVSALRAIFRSAAQRGIGGQWIRKP